MLTVRVRDASLDIVGELDAFESLVWTDRLHGVGGWALACDPSSVGPLLEPGAGLVVVDELDQVVMSGPTGVGPTGLPTYARDIGWADGAPTDTLVVYGTDDMVHLSDRLAHPSPAQWDPPFDAQAYDVRTGAASTVLLELIDVNAGPHAATPRRVAGLALSVDPVAGATVTARARWQNLLGLLGELGAAGGVVCTVRHSSGTLLASVRSARDLSSAVAFSASFGNIDAASYAVEAATATTVYVGGQGEGEAREVAVLSSPGRRIEAFVDRRDVDDSAELAAAAAAALVESAGRTSLQITPTETATCAYRRHYDLGDVVAVDIDGVRFAEQVTSVQSTLAAGAVTRQVTVGRESASGPLALFAGIRSLSRRVQHLERR